MRAGGYTVHQSLTAEAAAVLKMSLGLARRRGHAQVTPLHVAFTLLSSSSSSSSCLPPHLFASSSAAAAPATPSSYAYGVLRRACVKSHPAAAACSPAASHPLQCRALELCFNVALNRLPTTDVVMGGPQCSPLSSPSSSCASSASSTSFSASLIPHNPTLSNALVAALKRAQANQRRGCVELQNQMPLPPPPLTQQQSSQQQQQQPLLAIKVELDQLVLSILDDPSVSRVMREAGFSSPAVKSNIEEESAMLLSLAHHSSPSSSSHAVAVRPQFYDEPYIDFPSHANGGDGSWPAQFLNQPGVGSSSKEDDMRAILEVMLRKQGRRTNPVVVGDSVSVAEASVAELMRRLERGEVPDELRGAHVLRLNLPSVHARLMTRADVDARVADLRRRVHAHAVANVAGLVIYVGDIRWAVCEEDDALADFSPLAHMVAELARLLAELRAAACGRAWLVAAASYQTYMGCQRLLRTSPLEATWALQPVVVPAGAGNGLALGPHAPPFPAQSMKEVKINRLGEIPLLDHAFVEEEDVPVLCAECANSFEKEASPVRAKAEGTTLALTYFPGWPRADEPQALHKDELMELKRKWSRSCQRLHFPSNQPSLPSNASPIPWWRSSLPNHRNKPKNEPKPSSAGVSLSFDTPSVHGTGKGNDHDVQTTLSLLLPDSPTTYEEAHCDRSEGLDGDEPADAAICSGDAVSSRQPWMGVGELPFGHLKRKAEGILPPLGEPKLRRHGSGGLDLNLCAADGAEEGGGDSEAEQPVPRMRERR